MRVAQHEFPNPSDEAVCLYCGDKQRIAKERSCVGREVPRATPPSIFAGDISHIGERAKAIRAEEDARWQEQPK